MFICWWYHDKARMALTTAADKTTTPTGKNGNSRNPFDNTL
ncbi:hypothetical protein [Anaeromassilibacillus sp. An172]|nr:hypothetical protein [Anaeromassilibacillus sp. An172]